MEILNKGTIVIILCTYVLLYNDVTSASNDLSSCSSIYKIDCSGKNVTLFPSHLSPIVTTVDLSYNFITHIPHINVTKPAAVQLLNLSHNGITDIQHNAFKDLELMEVLDLSYNKLTYDDILIDNYLMLSQFYNLQRLILRGNPLDRVQDMTFIPFGYPELQELDMSFCAIRHLEPKAFDGISALTVLNLSHNLIETFTPDILFGVLNLEKLDLSYNRIQVVAEFPLITTLQDIRLDHNQIVRIEDNVFHYAHDLETLTLNHNKLATLTHLSVPFADVKNIDISSNPIRCDCHMQWVASMDISANSNISITCVYPARLRGKNALELQEMEFSCAYPILNVAVSLIVFGVLLILSMILGFFFLRKCKSKNWSCKRCHEVKGEYRAVRMLRGETNDDSRIIIEHETKKEEEFYA